MASKSALPTPTITMESGVSEALTIVLIVSCISVITPSVMTSSTKYSCVGPPCAERAVVSAIEMNSEKFVGP